MRSANGARAKTMLARLSEREFFAKIAQKKWPKLPKMPQRPNLPKVSEIAKIAETEIKRFLKTFKTWVFFENIDGFFERNLNCIQNI